MVLVEVPGGDDPAAADPAAADHADAVAVLLQGAPRPPGAHRRCHMAATPKAPPLGTQHHIQVIFFHSLPWICQSKITQKALHLMYETQVSCGYSTPLFHSLAAIPRLLKENAHDLFLWSWSSWDHRKCKQKIYWVLRNYCGLLEVIGLPTIELLSAQLWVAGKLSQHLNFHMYSLLHGNHRRM